MERRTAVKHIAAAPFLASGLLTGRNCWAGNAAVSAFHLATFAADVTPPLGSPLCGGLLQAAQVVDDRLQVRGVVLLGGAKPIVLAAIDWVQINNATYDLWREAIAVAAGTDVSHVAIHCVHPHDTPWVDIDADRAIQSIDDALEMVDATFVRAAIAQTAAAVTQSLGHLRPITHIGVGQGKVEKVASNRRVPGTDGSILARMSKCTREEIRDAPEGLIDPWLKTVSLWNGKQPVAALHYYATHPMSYYGHGHVTSDFCGLARNQRQREQPTVFQVYFTGCAGDIAPGKYNDGSMEMRPILRDRIHAGMVAAWEATRCESISKLDWTVTNINLPPRTEEKFSQGHLQHVLANTSASPKHRIMAAAILSWLNRIDKPVEMSCLRIGKTSILHLPGEPFIEYQLFAQAQRPDNFVCVAGYGDGGMGYIPLSDSYAQGGYEPTWSFVAPKSEQLLKAKLRKLLVAHG